MTILDEDAPARFSAPAPAHRYGWWNRHNAPDLAASATVALTAAALVFTNITGSPGYQDDEGVYAAEAMSIGDGHLAPYTYWYDHPPFGWIQLAIIGTVTRLLGLGAGTDLGAVRYAIGLFFVASAVLVYLVARRVGLPLAFAALASGLFVFSPLALSSGRQVFLDCIATTWVLLAFYLALSPRLALWSHAAAGATFAVATLSKLTSAIMGPALLFAILDRRAWNGRQFSVVACLSIGASVLAFFPLMALLRGELLTGEGHVSLQDGLLYQFASRAGSGWIWQPGSARHELLSGWLGADAFLIVAGALGALACLATRRTRWITVAVVSAALPVVVGQGYLPAMYIIGSLPFLALAIGSAGHLAWRQLQRLAPRLGEQWGAAAVAVGGGLLVAGLIATPALTWADDDAALLTRDDNADWNSVLQWVRDEVPRDDDVLVPYSLWQDLNAAGWHDPWSMIAIEKVDLDDAFDTAHPGGWREIEWIVEGPTVEPNLRYLGLEDATAAYEHSSIVATFGAWNIRRIQQ